MSKKMLIAVAIAGLFSATADASAQLVVIVNGDNPVASLSQGDVRAYFMKTEPRWDNGEKVRPIDRAGSSAERTAFISDVLGISDAELERHWIEKQYASAATPATRAPDASAVISLVRAFPGGIGFISQATWDDADHTGLKAVFSLPG